VKLSTRARYGTRALLDVALHYREGPVLLKDIAHRQEISLPYLEHLIAPLIVAGIVRSTRGARGGISLLKPPSEIKLSEVLDSLEGSIAPVECIGNPKVCSRSGSCAARDVWSGLQEAMTGFLGSLTLQDLVERQNQKEHTAKSMYYI
jgi:Rrf2 family protein